VLLPEARLAAGRVLARSLRASAGGLRGVQALVFELPGGRIQLSMNLFRVDETPPDAVVGELRRRGVEVGELQVVGLCPATAANDAASGRILEARIGAAVAWSGSVSARNRGGEELTALAIRLEAEAAGLGELGTAQGDLLAGAERCAALPPVLKAAGLLDEELDTMALLAARGMRDALSQGTRSNYTARMEALDRRLA